MNPEDRLAEAQKQLRIAAADDEVSEIQADGLAGLVAVINAMEDSMRLQRDHHLVTDGGVAVPERYQPEPRQWEDKHWLQKQYWGEFKAIKQIAAEQGIAHDRIGDQLEQHGIPTRVDGYTQDNSVSPFAGFYRGTDAPARTDEQSRTRYDPDLQTGHEADADDDGSFRWGVVDHNGDRR